MAARWRDVGTALRLKSGDLDTIDAKHRGNPQDCLTDVVMCWLKRNYNTKRFGEPTWRKLVGVVAHEAAGGNVALAREIARRHSGWCVIIKLPRFFVFQPCFRGIQSYIRR